MKEVDAKELYKYYEEEYGSSWPAMLEIIENFACTGPYAEIAREYVLQPHGYSESSLETDTWYDVITNSIRKGQLEISCDQAKKYLRLYHLVRMFDSFYNTQSPDDPEAFKQYCLNHPFWHRLQRQARKTLESLKINKK